MEGPIDHQRKIHERSYLTLLSSSGSMLWFGEDCDPALAEGTTIETSSSLNYRTSAFGVFEQLINTSELDGLVFGGDFVGKDPTAIKKKLSLNNTDYVVCPAREGCTLTAALRSEDESSLAIVAVRVLVGSMPDLVPREITVMGSGRTVKLMQNLKRWYDFHLTDEEILLSLRNGFVTIWISSCHDASSAAVIDSVEVYARARTDLAISKEDPLRSKNMHSIQIYPLSDSVLVTYIHALTYLTQITGQNTIGSLSARSAETISLIIQQTALESAEHCSLRGQVLEFLSEAEADAGKRAFFVDYATLRGLMSLLQGLGLYLLTEFANVDMLTPKQEEVVQRALGMMVQILSSTTAIAQARCGNYVNIISTMIAENLCQVSMALEGKKIIDFCQHLKAMFGVALRLGRPTQIVSELMLLEIPSAKSDFAQFDSLAEFFVSDSTEVIKACCSAVSGVIGNYNICKSDNITSSEKELSSMPVMYQCDACLTFPITGQRHTLGGEMDIDLCKRCYELGTAYSSSNDHNDPVIINGRTLCVENKDMTCGMILQMTPQPIAASSLEQAENAKKAGLLNSMTCAAQSAHSTFLAGSTNQNMDVSGSVSGGLDEAVTEGYRSHLFTKLLSLITDTLDAETNSSPPSRDVLQLVLNLVLGSCKDDIKTARGNEAASAFTKNLPRLVKKACQLDDSNSSILYKIIVSLRTLTSLVVQDGDMKRDPTANTVTEGDVDTAGTGHRISKDKTDPR